MGARRLAWSFALAAASLGGVLWLTARPDSAIAAVLACAWYSAQVLVLWATLTTHPTDRSSALVPTAAIVAATAALVRLVSYDPFLDPACRIDCSHPAVAVLHSPGRAAVALVTEVAALSLASAWCAALAVRSRRRWFPVGVAGIVLASASVAAQALATLASGVRTEVARWSLVGGVCALAIAALVVVVDRSVTSRRLARLSAEITEGGGSAQEQLQSLLHDAALVVRDPAEAGAVAPAELGPRRLIAVTSRGEPVAVVECGAETRTADLDRLLRRPHLQLALQNEHLGRRLVAQVEELRAARLRLVAAEHAERAALARDLHDGAQADALALAFGMRDAARAAERTGDAALAARCRDALDLTTALLGRLRQVSGNGAVSLVDDDREQASPCAP